MKSNSYIGLLDSDTILVKHPKTGQQVKLHRIIALKSFQVQMPGSYGITDIETAKKYKAHAEKYLTEIQLQIDKYNEHLELISEEIEHIKSTKPDSIEYSDVRKKYADVFNSALKLDSQKSRWVSKYHYHDDLIDGFVEPYVISVKVHQIGGYVESIDNLDPDNPVWVDHRSRVFGNAKIINGSHLTENCVVYDDAVIDGSRLENYVRVHDQAYVKSTHAKDLAEIKNSSKVVNSLLENSAMVFGSAEVTNCIINTGALCRDTSKSTNSLILDISRIEGDAIVTDSVLENMSFVNKGTHTNAQINEDVELGYRIGEGEL